MKNVKDLIDVEVLGINEKKNSMGAGGGIELSYYPGGDILRALYIQIKMKPVQQLLKKAVY